MPNFVPLFAVEKVGWCVDSVGQDQNDGVIKIPGTTDKGDCFTQCKAEPEATGCEYTDNNSWGCDVHTAEVAGGSGAGQSFAGFPSNGWSCLILPKGTFHNGA